MTDGISSPFNNTKLVRIAWLVRELGITTVIILVFLGLFIGWVKSPMTEGLTLLQVHTKENVEFQGDLRSILKQLVRAQQTTCVIQAKDEQQRRLCVQ